MRYVHCTLLLASLIFFACKENKTEVNHCVPQTKIDIPLEESSGISSLFIDTVLYVKLQEPQNTFRDIDRLKIYDDTIYILDERLSKLMSFDKEGDFITQYGERGRSKSEYVRMNSFDVDKHYVYLYDDASEKMSLFTHDGQFVQKVETPFWGEDFKVLNDGAFLFSLKPGKSNVKLCMTDSLFNIKKVFSYFDERDQDNYSSYSLFQIAGDSIYYTDDMSDTTFVFTSKGELVHSYFFNLGKGVPPLEARYNADRLIKDKDKYVFMYTCPLIFDSKVVMFLRNRNLRTVVYYNMEKRIGGSKDIDKDLSPTDIIIPLYMVNGYVVGYLEDYCLERFEDKAILPMDVVQHLENGYRVVAFYRLRQ